MLSTPFWGSNRLMHSPSPISHSDEGQWRSLIEPGVYHDSAFWEECSPFRCAYWRANSLTGSGLEIELLVALDRVQVLEPVGKRDLNVARSLFGSEVALNLVAVGVELDGALLLGARGSTVLPDDRLEVVAQLPDLNLFLGEAVEMRG